MQVTTIGIDLAKNIFQVHGITESDEVAFNRPLRRAQVLPFFARLDPCLVGMEACCTSHYWARELTRLGHEVRLIPPIYVKPYVKRGKSDAIDAEAICEAVTRPTMRFVEAKSVEPQALLSLHRARSLMVRQCTQLVNALRSMLAEFGVYIAKGLARAISFSQGVLAGAELELPEIAQDVVHNLCGQLDVLHGQIHWYETHLRLESKRDLRVKLLQTIPGVGPVTASAVAASIGSGHQFKNGREFAAWLAQLVSGVERVGQGELDTRIDVKSTDEVGTLSASFNAMTDELQSLYARLEQRFSTIISQTPIIVFSTDEEGNIKLVEGKGLSASGMTPEHLVGQNLKDLLGVSFAPEFDKNSEFKSITDIGDQVFDVWCAPASTNKGTSEELIGVATNVTQQARAQEKLERQARDLSVLNGQVTEKNDMLESLSSKLSKYLSPQVYSSIFRGAQNVEISAQRKKLTVFFSDLAGFTETTEKLESEELTELLEQYLTEMSDIALRHGATIDKYVGDAIVIFLGPETRGEKEDALACVRMAVEMQERMETLGVEWRDKGVEHPLRCRIGINTGYCTVGNFGSKDRMDYTIIGGGVNLASRLEGLASPGDISVSFETHAYVKNQIVCEEFGQHEVKGIAYPVTSFRVAKSEEKKLATSLAAMGVNLPDGISCYSESEKSELATHLETFLDKLRSKT